MTKKTFTFQSSNGKNTIAGMMWLPDYAPRAILQISHGMMEYIERYQDFAAFLVGHGILVVGNDHLGHGGSVEDVDGYGYFGGRDGGHFVVEDLCHLTRFIKNEYPDIPYFLLGHSMGSFMVRRYVMGYGNQIDGVIIMGTGQQNIATVRMGKILIALVRALRGDHHRSKLLDRAMFGNYDKKIVKKRTGYDWLTTDEKVVDQYAADPRCTFLFTTNGNLGLMNTILYIRKKKHICKVPKKLPMLIVAGKEDPVGGYGRDVEKYYSEMCAYGMKDIKCHIYDGMRHEILNETDRMQVYEDILNWLENRI